MRSAMRWPCRPVRQKKSHRCHGRFLPRRGSRPAGRYRQGRAI